MSETKPLSTSPSCPLCEADCIQIKAPPVAIGHEFFQHCTLGLAHCRQCGVRFVSPRPGEEALSDFYNADGYECHTVVGGSDPAIRLKIVERFISAGSLCDFGAGAGRLLRHAREKGWRTYGIEPGRSRLALTAEGFSVYPDGHSLPDVDVITMIHVLEHLPDPFDSLSQLSSRTNLLYLEVPNADSLRARLADSSLKRLFTHAPERCLAFPIHLFYFNIKSLSTLLDCAGFDVIESGTLGMGVEELFKPRPAAKRASDTPSSSEHIETRPRRPFVTARKLIKQTFSQLHLGENLYIVAKSRSHSAKPQ